MDTNHASHKRSKGSSRDSRRSVPESGLFVQSSPQTQNVHQGNSLSFEPAQMRIDSAQTKMIHSSNSRPYLDQFRPSSASTCGDLEGPHRITAYKQPGTSYERNVTDAAGRIISPGVYDTALSHRSRSRTSNISIKRSNAGKQNKPDPERKKLLMNQVARYWNECIGLADEERAHAKAEAESLRDDLHRQQAKLQEAQASLDKERTDRQALEDRLEVAEKTQAVIRQENSELVEQVGQLKEDLETSKERAKTLNGKYRTYRAKLNEAIIEQQQLFTKAKDLYNESIRNLRQEHEARMLESKGIEKALAESAQKQTKMKECLEELRSSFEKQMQEKQEEISQLKTKSIEQDQALQAEKKISDELRNQLESERASHGMAMKQLSDSMKDLQECMKARVLEQPQGLELPMHVQERLHILEEALQSCASSVFNQSNFESMVQKLGERIMTDINPALCDINQCQAYTNEMLSLISSGCATELGLVQGELKTLTQKQVEATDLVAQKAEVLSNNLECIRDGVAATQGVCGDIDHSLQSWFTEERRSMSEEQSSWKKDVILQITQRNQTIDELKKLCGNATHMHSAKLEQLRNSLATKEEGKQLAQAMMEEFRFVLDHELSRDKAKAEHDSKQTQHTLASLENQINTVVDHFEKNKMELCDAQRASLQHMIQGLQAEAKATADLRNRWHSDVKLIDSMRSKLESVQKLMPYIDQCHQAIDSISRVEDLIEHTSKTIDQEHRWVRQQLEEQAHAQTQAGDTLTATANAVTPGLHQPPQVHVGLLETASECIERRIIDAQAHCETGHVDSVQASLQETMRRRVHVHSPIEPFCPANALSVEQEQRRRRGPFTVPSILKSNGASSSQETTAAEDQCSKTETELGPVHEYRKKRVQSANSREETQRMIHEIGSSFITEKTARSAFDLPKITDYQPLLVTSKGVANTYKRKIQNNEDEDSARVQRLKVL
ncbi:hypothetical protein E4U41_007042 [Claviceps citrina]|nr:hypothetical protein E4U41_007042 [Claviceps citrina]